MSTVESMFKAIESVSCQELSRYGMKIDELAAVYQRGNKDMYKIINWAFKYGFVKGKRCEKAKRQRKENVA